MARLNGEGSNPTTRLRRGLPLLVHKPGMSSCEEPDEVADVLVNRVLADQKLMTVLDTFIAPRRITVAAGRPWTKFRLAGDDRVRNAWPTATGPRCYVRIVEEVRFELSEDVRFQDESPAQSRHRARRLR